MIIVTKEAYNILSEHSKSELLAAVFGTPKKLSCEGSEFGFSDGDWVDVARLTPGQVESLIDDATSLYEGTKAALKLIAEDGPILHSTEIKEKCVDDSGTPYWEDLGKFQGGTTRRVRAVTGNKHAMLLAWPEWEDGEGYYGVTRETYRALRIYFKLD